MVKIRIDTEEGETRKDVITAIGAFIVQYIIDETREAYANAYDRGYEDGHKDGMTEAVTHITE